MPGENTHNMSPFIHEMYMLLDKEIIENQRDIISWSDDGNDVVIKDISKFEKYLLCKVINGKTTGSFIRQMNIYGFRKKKAKKSCGSMYFTNTLFRRGRADLALLIKRKPEAKLRRGRDLKDTVQSNLKQVGDLSSIAAECEQLKQHLSHSRHQVKGIIEQMETYHEDRAKRIENFLHTMETLVSQKEYVDEDLSPLRKRKYSEYCNSPSRLARYTSARYPSSFINCRGTLPPFSTIFSKKID